MRWYCNILIALALLVASTAGLAQSPTYGIGRTPSQEEIDQWPKSIPPSGEGLPPGRGTVEDGEALYNQRCIFCHGPEGRNGPYPQLQGAQPYLPFVTSMWDYIHRAMPRSLENVGAQAMQLTPDQTYALSAYILYLNEVVEQDAILDRETLLQVRLPIHLMTEQREHDSAGSSDPNADD